MERTKIKMEVRIYIDYDSVPYFSFVYGTFTFVAILSMFTLYLMSVHAGKQLHFSRNAFPK